MSGITLDVDSEMLCERIPDTPHRLTTDDSDVCLSALLLLLPPLTHTHDHGTHQ